MQMKKKKNLLMVLVFCLSSLSLFAQNARVTGVVLDDKSKEPVIGASIIQRGTADGKINGTVTDVDGKFVLTLPENSFIEVSYVGYENKSVQLGKETEITVYMKESNTLLDQVVVVGYGTQKAKDMTAPIAVVDGDELSKQLTSNALQALQGKVAGVQVINNGAPGSGSTIKIRGVGSIGDFASPLYIVDGVFVDNIDFISSSDIETMTVLKDASSAAIYGVRAANGVILVTTKRGKSGRPHVSYDGYVAAQVPVNVMKLASRDQYVDMLNEANANTTGYVPKVASDYPVSTDWYGELLKPMAFMQNHNLDISGRTEKSNYSFGINEFYQDGIMNAKNDYNRLNLRGNYEQQTLSWLKLGINTILSRYTKTNPKVDAFQQAFVNPPVYPVYDETNVNAYPERFGSPQQYGFGNAYSNPYASAYYNENKDRFTKLLFNLSADFKLIDDQLSLKASYNQDMTFGSNLLYFPEHLVGGSQQLKKSSETKRMEESSKQIVDFLLSWRNERNRHSWSVMLGQSTRIERSNNLWGLALGVPGYDDASKYLQNGLVNGRDNGDGGNLYHGVSFFTRGTYNYDSRYLATLTFRADASSKYQEKWGYFPSIGLGWVITGEDFMQDQEAFQYLKLRGSWGMLGNDNIPANSSVTLGTTGVGSSGIFGDKLVNGVGALTVVRNYLKWEVVNEFDVGLDFATLNNRLTGELDYYRRVTSNVVFDAPIATGGGSVSLLGNNGKVLNTGLELGLKWTDKVGDFQYSVGLNATTIHNEVLELNNRNFIPGASVRGNYTTRTQVGHSVGAFYGYEIDGVYQTEGEALRDPVQQDYKDAGYFKYRDQNGDKKITEEDKVFLGSPIPWLLGGLDFGFNYKGFDFSLSLQTQVGNKVLNAKRMNRDIFTDGNYDLDFFENAWRPDNKSNSYPSAEAYNKGYTQQANSFFVENASYLRLQNVTAGYTFKFSKFVESLRLYVSAQRPYTYFTYNGFTPEVSGAPISSGIDNSVYPMQGIYSFGAKINF